MDSQILSAEITDFGDILKTFDLAYIPDNYYWRVGNLKQTQGWILHLSGTKGEFLQQLHVVIPVLLYYKASFKIPRDSYALDRLLTGEFGYINLGKLICIYSKNDSDAEPLAQELIKLTQEYKGPAIPTDRYLGGNVYTRYGLFNSVHSETYSIPFEMPEGVPWPFMTITTPFPPPKRKLLNYVYYPILNIKPDAKGDVLKALYFKRFWKIRTCLIKQGRKHMHVDAFGRDIQDRLKWQYELYQALHKEISMPEVFDCFYEDGDAYLSMAFIKGVSLREWLNSIYRDGSWRDISVAGKLAIIQQLLQIIDAIQKLHEKGYVHRDITSGNFLIDRKGNIWLIDMELAWSLDKKYPNPPFPWGTPGYMSPQQIIQDTPTIYEDLYGLGALAIEFFTNLYPDKFDENSPDILFKALLFLTGERKLSQLLAASLSSEPLDRPNLSNIKDCLLELIRQMNGIEQTTLVHFSIFDNDQLRNTVQAGLRGLARPELMSKKGVWISPLQRQETHIGNAQMEVGLYLGWHTGVAGPLWLIAKAKLVGFDIKDCLHAYISSWNYIEKNSFLTPNSTGPGLYAGAAGIAMALAAGLRSELLAPDPDVITFLTACFSNIAEEASLSTGWAGQGLALLNCKNWLDNSFTSNNLSTYIINIVKTQQKDGSWIYDISKCKDIYTGLDRGVAGITLFLLNYLQEQEDPIVRTAAVKALDFLLKHRQKNAHLEVWKISTSDKTWNIYNIDFGMSGIVYAFIKAYEVLKDVQYKEIAEEILQNIQPHLIHMEFSIASGLAGMGEVYLEAWRVFKTSDWYERANWIAGALMHLKKKNEDDSFRWVHAGSFATADLFSGNSGIIFFLLKIYNFKNKAPFMASLL